jgi:hypothetical protein
MEKLDMYRRLYFLAQHGQRHLRQVAKIEAQWKNSGDFNF